MSERRSTIIEEDILDVDESTADVFRDEVFSNLSSALIEEKRLLKRFYDFCEEHTSCELDDMTFNNDETYDALRKTNKIRDKVLENIEEKLVYSFDAVETNTSTRSISMDLDAKEYTYRVTVEIMSDSFNLELS